MVFSRSVTALTYSDVEGLTSSGEPESVILDYKGGIASKAKDKAELAKDVSALANSAGGYIVIGVEEKRGKPVHPPTGLPRILDGHKVEEWIGQVVASNISPRVPVTIRPIEHGTDPGKCVVVNHVSVSPRAPHMVTAKGDNRYYRRYFKRQQFESLPAEEYEVRELFHRSTRMRDEVQALLRSRGFDRLDYGDYGSNVFSRRLSIKQLWEGRTSELTRADNFVVLTSCPEVLSPKKVSVGDDDFWAWMDADDRKYPPARQFVPYETKRPVSQGALFYVTEAKLDLWSVYLYVHDTGYVEMGLSVARSFNGLMGFALTTIVARYGQLLRFTADLYERYSILWSVQTAVHLSGTHDAVLYDLGRGWREPFEKIDPPRPQCMEHNVEIGTVVEATDLSGDAIDEYMRQMASDIDASFGSRYSRAFNHPKADSDQLLDLDKVHGY